MNKAMYILSNLELRTSTIEGIKGISDWLDSVFSRSIYSSDEDRKNRRIIHTMDDGSRIIEDINTGEMIADEGDCDA